MIEVPAAQSDASTDVRSFAACVASVLEISAAAVPAPNSSSEHAMLTWRQWLAGRGLGLVPVADASAFTWPGPFIARLAAPDGSRPAVVMFGVPPGVLWDPLGQPASAQWPVVEAFVIAALDVSEQASPLRAAHEGRVDAVLVAPAAGAAMQRLTEADAIAGHGLRGDRYVAGHGTFSTPGGTGGQITLIAAEALEATILPSGQPVTPEQARRNIVTRGIDLDALLGQRFAIGSARCVGRRRCEPCAHLERLTESGILRGLVHRGGLRADIETSGTIRPGDSIVL